MIDDHVISVTLFCHSLLLSWWALVHRTQNVRRPGAGAADRKGSCVKSMWGMEEGRRPVYIGVISIYITSKWYLLLVLGLPGCMVGVAYMKGTRVARVVRRQKSEGKMITIII
jgi:hypothetical protein